MKRRIIAGCTGLFLLVFLTACSVPLQQLKPGCTPQDLSGAVASGKYVKKVDNFHIILDISGSMSQKVSSAQKLATAKLVTDLMNRTIPDGMFTGGMRTLGLGGLLSMNTDLVYGPVKHSQADLAAVINGITRAQSNTPLALAIEGAQEDLKQTSGSIALIIISDWLADDAGTKAAAKKIKAAYGKRLCIYPIVIGKDKYGKKLAKSVAGINGCGFVAGADTLKSCSSMADYVKRVFFASPDAPGDTDGDGVIDPKDKCPNTPRGAKVDAYGCSKVGEKLLMLNINFDFDSAGIRRDSLGILDRNITTLKKNSSIKVRIEGHTDAKGSEAYNLGLSKKRAQAVVDYLISKGIAQERLASAGKGEAVPIATNDTSEGRDKNRRVEFIVTAK